MSILKLFVEPLGPPLRRVVRALDDIIREAVPTAEVSLKWGNLTYHGTRNFCSIVVHEGYVNLQVWGGASIPDPRQLLLGTGKSMRHIRIEPGRSLNRRAVIALVRAAARTLEK